jgi:hypothetical protein
MSDIASIVGLVNDELEMIWNEGTSGPGKVLSMHLPGGTEKTMQSLRIINVLAKIQIRHLADPSLVLSLHQPP